MRYDRYKAVVDQLTGRTTFELSDIRQACQDEQGSFVTRVVNEFVQSGWLVREDGEATRRYRWNSSRGEFSASRWLDGKLFAAQIKESPQQDRLAFRFEVV